MTRPILIIFLLMFPLINYAQLKIIITEIPEDSPENDPIYIAGNFNNWNPQSIIHQLKRTSNGYEITMNPTTPNLEFKFTRGDWKTVEVDSSGKSFENRVHTFTHPDTLKLKIYGWEDFFDKTPIKSSAAGNVSIIRNFEISQLNRRRNIWVYLPPDYDSTDQQYPVIYMHDGQNVFDDSTSFSGEWHVDETLNEMYQSGYKVPIVVGIDNGDSLRINEYSPWKHPIYGGGEGAEYVEFIVKTLKPYIDVHYRTLPDRENTAIMGSSMGGLISFYAGLTYPEVFSKLGVFSPSFPIYLGAYELLDNIDFSKPFKMYLLAGTLEEKIASEAQKMHISLLDRQIDENWVMLKIVEGADHNEKFWAEEFGTAFKWMFSKQE